MRQDAGSASRRTRVPRTGPGAGTRRGTAFTALAAAMLVVGRLFGPEPGGSAVHLIATLFLVACGIGVAVVGVKFAIRAVRAGRDLATGALVVGSFLVLWGAVVLIETFARYFGWH